MKTDNNRSVFPAGMALALTVWGLIARPAHACTIFVLTDQTRTLFCNNEDWSDPKTRIWFLPATDKRHGAVYVGFDNDYPQGGMNTEGLAFDWVAGYDETWKPDLHVPVVWGNSGQQALETCATVGEAIAFFLGHQDSGFHRAKILIADRTGASVIIGAKDGRLQIEKDTRCRGFGYGAQTLDTVLTKSPESTLQSGIDILRASRQDGPGGTKYSNVFDLKSGDIFLYPFPGRDDEVRFNLAAELAKGGHYYDMPEIHGQLARPPRPLLASMQRFTLDGFSPVPDKEPEVTDRVHAMLEHEINGAAGAKRDAVERGEQLFPPQKQIQEMVKSLGRFVSLSLVERSGEGDLRYYRYRVVFEKHAILQRLVFDKQNQLISSRTEDVGYE